MKRENGHGSVMISLCSRQCEGKDVIKTTPRRPSRLTAGYHAEPRSTVEGKSHLGEVSGHRVSLGTKLRSSESTEHRSNGPGNAENPREITLASVRTGALPWMT